MQAVKFSQNFTAWLSWRIYFYDLHRKNQNHFSLFSSLLFKNNCHINLFFVVHNTTILGVTMIISFKHKGLERFYLTGNPSGIIVAHSAKLKRILSRLNSAKTPQDMNIPGWNLHPLSAELRNHWLVKVNGNWRVTFKITNNHAEIVDYQDYH